MKATDFYSAGDSLVFSKAKKNKTISLIETDLQGTL